MTRSKGVTAALPSGTVTFLFSDIEGSTQRWAAHRAAMEDAVRLHDRVMRDTIATQGGHVFKTIGDAFCAAFTTPESAAAAALDSQRALGATDFSAVGGLRVRIAIHTGTADERGGDYFGPALNRVARLLALGHGGQVLLSSVAAGLVRQNPPSQASLANLGDHMLKDHAEEERVYQLVAPGLQRDFPELRSQKALQPWLVPEAMRTRYFTGRDDLLARVREQLEERHRAALTGLGGAGKTQTAIEYAVRHRAEYPNGVFWVNAETIAGLTSGFVEIAKTLRLPAAESNDQEQAVRAVVEWLNRSKQWLLILDNVDDRRDVQPFVPERGTGDLLITSRETVFGELGIPRTLELQDLDTEEAVRFLLARTGRDDADSNDRAAVEELATELGNLPLALEQAAAYIAETNAAFDSYLRAFRKRRVSLLEKAGGLIARDTVAATWAANFEAVEHASPAAADVLLVGAFLGPDAIPFELFLDGSEVLGDSIAQALADPDELSIAEVLRPLARYSLVRADGASRAFSVHRLVQEIVRTAVAESERRTYVERAVAALVTALPEIGFANWSRHDRLVPHVISIAKWLDSYEIYSEAGHRILNETGRYLLQRGRYSDAEPLLERALVIAQRAFGLDEPKTASSLHNLALLRFFQGRYAEAQTLHERALAIRERTRDDESVSASLTNLANVFFMLARYGEARPLYERSWAIGERAFLPDDPRVAIAINNLAETYVKQGRYAEADPLFQRSLASRERALGPDHPHVALSLNNLAELARLQSHYAAARPLFERALVIRERAYGPNHEELAESLDGLAYLDVKECRYDEARQLYKRALAIQERALGPDHPEVARSLEGLASVHAQQGRFAEAETLFERALAIRERALGPNHPDVIPTVVGLASLRKEQGRHAEAVALYERALDIKEQTFAADHPELAELRSTIGALRAATATDTASQGRPHHGNMNEFRRN